MPSEPVIGIDLCADERRASGVCVLRGQRVRTLLLRTDEEMCALSRRVHPRLVTIDAPLSLPPGRNTIHDRNGEHYRPCDRALQQRGIRFFPITLGGMRKLTERGMALKASLEADGFAVVEVFPGGAQDVLGLPRKQHDLDGLRDGLRRLGLQGIRDDATHDELDAVTAAYTGQLFLRGEAEVLGEEGCKDARMQGCKDAEMQGGTMYLCISASLHPCIPVSLHHGIVMPKAPIYPPEFLDGLRLYWRGSYWHSHEAWEDLWRVSDEPQRSFLQALVQIDAALIHSERGHWRGVRNLLTRALDNLSRCPDKVMGVAVPSLRRQVETFRAEVDALLHGRNRAFNWRVKPRLAPDGVPPPARERLRRAADDLPDRVKERLSF